MPIFSAACPAAEYERERDAVEEAVAGSGGSVTWLCSRRFGWAFASIELRTESGLAALRAATSATVYEATIIALAVSPTLPEALPALEEALTGPGRPSAIVLAEAVDGAICVAWDLAKTDAGVVMAVIDAELRRFGAARTAELLSPLPIAAMTAIVAEGLNAPEIAPDRVLEVLIESRYVVRD